MKRWSTPGEAVAYEMGYIEGKADIVRCKDCIAYNGDNRICYEDICASENGYCWLGEKERRC